MTPTNTAPAGEPSGQPDRAAVYFLAASLIALAAAWFLLNELAPLLRPLFLAVLLAYIILPIHQRLRQHVPAPVATAVIAAGSVALLLGLAELLSISGRQLTNDLPDLAKRGAEILRDVGSYYNSIPWLKRMLGDLHEEVFPSQEQVQTIVRGALSHVVGTLGEAVVVCLYLMFILVEAGRFPGRIRQTFAHEKAKGILNTVEVINEHITRYLRAKVLSSFVLAAPVVVILLIFKVKFALLWGLLTFLFNFIPYIGSMLGFGLPVLFTFLFLPSPGTAVVVAVLILACHLASASFVEPSILGKAVGLPPLVILMALTFWGLCWGVGGMLLAVPLTVMLKIVMDHVEATRPVARLLGDE
jgi:AI-2 transport protein TqsA